MWKIRVCMLFNMIVLYFHFLCEYSILGSVTVWWRIPFVMHSVQCTRNWYLACYAVKCYLRFCHSIIRLPNKSQRLYILQLCSPFLLVDA